MSTGQKLANETRKPLLPSHARSGRSTKSGAASNSTGDTPFPRGHCLLLCLLAMAQHAASAAAFATRDELEAAMAEFCADPATAESTHGMLTHWNVSAVTDMGTIVAGSPCKATFNSDLNGWDVSQVTNMEVRLPIRIGLRRGGGLDRRGSRWPVHSPGPRPRTKCACAVAGFRVCLMGTVMVQATTSRSTPGTSLRSPA